MIFELLLFVPQLLSAGDFLIPLDTVIQKEFVIEATVTVSQKKNEGWKVAGIGIRKDASNFWHIALVESPERWGSYHAVEVKEMTNGIWGSQEDLTRFSFNMDWNKPTWMYDVPYRLKFISTNNLITGQVYQNGEIISQITFIINRTTANVGTPVIHLVGLEATFDDFLVRAPTQYETTIGDSFGQAAFIEWANKVRSDKDLLAFWRSEEEALKLFRPNPDFDAFGGHKFTTTRKNAFFRVENLDGKWWFITPLGHPFFSLGIGVVSLVDTYTNTYEGFDLLFSGLQREKEPFSFYISNLRKRYGDDYFPSWLNNSLRRLKAWGFNTLGTWSIIPKEDKMPYTVHFASYYPDLPLINDRFPDVFSKKFEEDYEEIVKPFAESKMDPYLLGYFVDGELLWSGEWSTKEPFLLVEQVMSLPRTAPAKRALVDFLRKEYGNNIREFNSVYGTKFRNFEEISESRVPDFSRKNEENARKFLRLLAHKYFGTVSRALKAVDPNHLYLGCKFGWWSGEPTLNEILDIIDLYADVISFDIYDYEIDKETFSLYITKTNKPMLIDEFSFGALDRGLGGSCSVKNQKERGTAYRYYVENAASLPYIIGCHWFEYIDQPLTGRFDGENYNIGFVDVCDIPYWDLVSQAKKTNQRIYNIHLGKLSSFSHPPQRF